MPNILKNQARSIVKTCLYNIHPSIWGLGQLLALPGHDNDTWVMYDDYEIFSAYFDQAYKGSHNLTSTDNWKVSDGSFGS